MTVARRGEERRGEGRGGSAEFMAMHWWFWYCTEA
jgi:hypothetical protein